MNVRHADNRSVAGIPQSAIRNPPFSRHSALRYFVTSSLLLCLSGCIPCPPPDQRPPAALFTADQALARVNDNNLALDTALIARRVTARGYITTDSGSRRAFDLSGGMLYLKPRCLYLDLKQLTQTAIRIGSNDSEYWLWFQPEVDTLWWGHHDALDGADEVDIPVRPDQLIEALGQGPIDPLAESVFRVMGEHHQLLILVPSADGRRRLTQEYWLDRHPPYLIGKLLFRDADGRVAFYAELGDYRRIADDEPLVAHRLNLRWPKVDAQIEIRIGEWARKPDATAASSAFVRVPDRPTTILTDPPNLSDSDSE